MHSGGFDQIQATLDQHALNRQTGHFSMRHENVKEQKYKEDPDLTVASLAKRLSDGAGLLTAQPAYPGSPRGRASSLLIAAAGWCHAAQSVCAKMQP